VKLQLEMPTRQTLYRLKLRTNAAVLALIGVVVLLAASVVAGWASAWYVVERGSRLTTQTVGPWVSWTSAARPDADPYTRAHFVRAGSMLLSADIARTWQAQIDAGGQRLHSACDYLIEGALDMPWWSLTVFDDRGRLIANAAERHGYTSDTIALGADGRFSITLGRDARPGNWVPTGGAGRLALVLTVLDQRSALADASAHVPLLPEIKRVGCR
jgi:hypothetical protein